MSESGLRAPPVPDLLTIDLKNKCVWKSGQPITLTPKCFAVLRCLVERSGEVVSSAELLQTAWAGVNVGRQQVKQFVAELRKRLGDGEQGNCLIETVRGYGYRYVGNAQLSRQTQCSPVPCLPSTITAKRSFFVGRNKELDHLRNAWSESRHGALRVCWITGDSGYGKTTLIDHFLDTNLFGESLWILKITCLQRYCCIETVQPLLTAIGDLDEQASPGEIIALLKVYAPRWLPLLPRNLGDALERGIAANSGINTALMIGEFVAFIRGLSSVRPVLLRIEDADRADELTLATLEMLTNEPSSDRIMVLASCRTLDMLTPGEDFTRLLLRLWVLRQADRLHIDGLSHEDISNLLHACGKATTWGVTIYEFTQGHPLLVALLLEYWDEAITPFTPERRHQPRKAPNATVLKVPTVLRTLITNDLQQLSHEHRDLLETASLAGECFSAATLAAALETTIHTAEAICETLAHKPRFLRQIGKATWPDGTVATAYAFSCPLYRQVVSEQVTSYRSSCIHAAVGARLQQAYGERYNDIATELAWHFDECGDHRLALDYLSVAARNAMERSAYRDAVVHLKRALSLIHTVTDPAERAQMELTLRIGLGLALSCLRSLADVEVRENYSRALDLCNAADISEPSIALIHCTVGLNTFFSGEVRRSLEIGQQLLASCARSKADAATSATHAVMALISFYAGDFISARTHALQGCDTYDQTIARRQIATHARDPGMISHAYLALTEWITTATDGSQNIQACVRNARDVAHPYSVALALYHAAMYTALNHDLPLTQRRAAAAVTYACDHGFPWIQAASSVLQGWAEVCSTGEASSLTLIHNGLKLFSSTGMRAFRPWYTYLLAEAYQRLGKRTEALEAVEEAFGLVMQTGEHFAEAQLHRLRGVLLVEEGCPDSAEEALLHSLHVARNQGAQTWSIATSVVLAKLWIARGQHVKATTYLADALSASDTAVDLPHTSEATALLHGLQQAHTVSHRRREHR